jgi:hypothetical protein
MTAAVTLRALLDLNRADIERALEEQARYEGAEHARALAHVVGFVAGIGAGELNKALDVDVVELLARAWAGADAVRDAARDSRSTPGERTLMALGPHEFTHRCEPVLRLVVADKPLPALRLVLELVARFNCVKLAVSDGRLRAIAPGDASAVIRLKYNDVKLKEKSWPVWNLPAEIPLGPGVPIG